jgi:glycosyltransferase involved in cell wall biosynthesis
MNVAAVSTFRTPCGVGKYFEELAYPLSKVCNLKIYAEQTSKEEPPIQPEKLNYARNWKRGFSLNNLYTDIVFDSQDVVHVQYEGTIFPEPHFLDFCRQVNFTKIPLVITLHNVPLCPHEGYSFWYDKINAHYLCTNDLMKNELLKWHPSAETSTIPLGTTIFTPLSKLEARKQLGIDNASFYLVQIGFYGEDKGILPLVESLPKILKDIPNAKLIFAGSLHPLSPLVHKQYMEKCMKTAYRLGLQDKIIFTGEFLSEQKINQYLSATDFVVINHQQVFGLVSASASAHRVLCAQKPILMNAEDTRLSEYKDKVHCLKMTNSNIAEKVLELYHSKELQQKIIKGAKEYGLSSSFKEISEKTGEVYKKCIQI